MKTQAIRKKGKIKPKHNRNKPDPNKVGFIFLVTFPQKFPLSLIFLSFPFPYLFQFFIPPPPLSLSLSLSLHSKAGTGSCDQENTYKYTISWEALGRNRAPPSFSLPLLCHFYLSLRRGFVFPLGRPLWTDAHPFIFNPYHGIFLCMRRVCVHTVWLM